LREEAVVGGRRDPPPEGCRDGEGAAMPLARPLFSRSVLSTNPPPEPEEVPPAQRGIILLRDRGTRRRAAGAALLPPETLALPPTDGREEEDVGMAGGLACTPARV